MASWFWGPAVFTAGVISAVPASLVGRDVSAVGIWSAVVGIFPRSAGVDAHRCLDVHRGVDMHRQVDVHRHVDMHGR